MTFPNLRRKIKCYPKTPRFKSMPSAPRDLKHTSIKAWAGPTVAQHLYARPSLGTRVSSNNKKTLEAHNPATLQLELQTFLHNYDEHLVSAFVGGSKVAAPYRYVARITIFNSYFQAQFFPQRCQRTGHWNLRYPFYRIELFQSALRYLKKLAQRLVIKSG